MTMEETSKFFVFLRTELMDSAKLIIIRPIFHHRDMQVFASGMASLTML